VTSGQRNDSRLEKADRPIVAFVHSSRLRAARFL
jgi:hypothetical protein